MTAPVAAAPQGGPSAPQAQQPIDRYIVGQAKPPEQPGSPMIDLTLEKAIQIALDNNLDLQSARINPILQDFSLRASRAFYLPTLSGTFSNNHNQSPPSNTLTDAGLKTSISTVQQYSTTFSQNVPWYGG
ncbi:MAG: TolC family protein, partial [bacterium]